MRSVTTIKVKVSLNPLLLQTMQSYSRAIAYIAGVGSKAGIVNRYKLHHLVYYDARERFGLPSQFVINANRIASQTLKSIKIKKGKTPIFKTLMPLDFDARNSKFSWDEIKLTTIRGRIEVKLNIAPYYLKYRDWKYQTCKLTTSKFGTYLHITLSKSINVEHCLDGLPLGVDAGINNIAVTSSNQFFSGKPIKKAMIKFKCLRARLQSKGTLSAKRLLKKLSGRERRFKAYWNHVISKAIVEGCRAPIIVLENLKGIRKMKKGRRMNFWLHGWSFFQLQSFIQYKAERLGIKIMKVKPYMSSQTCSSCGLVGERDKGFFKCACGYSLNSDLNASRVLAKRHSIADAVFGSRNTATQLVT